MSGGGGGSSSSAATVALSAAYVAQQFRPVKAFGQVAAGAWVTSIDYDDSGEWLITAGTDEGLQLYNCRTAKHSKTSLSKKYGCDLARFTHLSSNVVYASTKENDVLRYLSLHDNSYIRYFRGHTARVVSLDISPADDHMISGSADGTVKLWDLRSPNCHGNLDIGSPSRAVFDPNGVIFAVANKKSTTVMLYDMRSFDKMPFSTFRIRDAADAADWQGLEFSNDGRSLMLSTDGASHYVLDAFNGAITHQLVGDAHSAALGPACFTPDAKLVMSLSRERRLSIYDTSAGELALKPAYTVPCPGDNGPTCLAFNPRFAHFTTAGTNVTFWTPEEG